MYEILDCRATLAMTSLRSQAVAIQPSSLINRIELMSALDLICSAFINTATDG
jgi:hypothetical protein